MKNSKQPIFRKFRGLQNRCNRALSIFIIGPMLLFGQCSEAFPEMDGLDAVLLSNSLKKYLFATQSTYPGTLKRTTDANGIEGADAICAFEKFTNFSQLPGADNEYRALLVSDHRRACTSANCNSGGSSEHLDWVLTPNTSYYNPDDQFLFTTNSNSVLDLSTTPLSRVLTTTVAFCWTGFESTGDWRTSTVPETCGNWNTGGTGMRGDASTTGPTALGDFGQDSLCGTAHALICVRR